MPPGGNFAREQRSPNYASNDIRCECGQFCRVFVNTFSAPAPTSVDLHVTPDAPSPDPNCVAGVRGLEPPDVISTIFVAAARGQNVSSPTISANQREFPQLFQPFRENDICEFESSHPSHAVGSLWGAACVSNSTAGGRNSLSLRRDMPSRPSTNGVNLLRSEG